MKGHRLVTAVVLATIAYAVVRYHVFKEVPWAHLPVYVLNKVASVVGLVLIGAAPYRRTVADRKRIGTLGLTFVAGHLMLSLLILNPSYFAKFYATDGAGVVTMTWQAEAAMLAGVVGTVLLAWLFAASLDTPSSVQNGRCSLVPGLGRWVLIATAAHVLCMGYTGWWPVSKWAEAGYLPPITLLSFVIAIGFVAARFVRRRRGVGPSSAFAAVTVGAIEESSRESAMPRVPR